MRPDYHPLFARAVRSSRRDTTRAPHRVDGPAQYHPRQRPRSNSDRARRDTTRFEDTIPNEDTSYFDRNDNRPPFARAKSASPAYRPQEQPRTFDIKSEQDLAAMIGAIRDAHRKLNIQRDIRSTLRQKRLKALEQREAAAGPVEERRTKNACQQAAPTPSKTPEVVSRLHKRVRVWIGTVAVIGAFAAGIYARDNLAVLSDPLGYTAQLLARSASALVALQDSNAHSPKPALLRTTSASPNPTGRGTSLVLPDSYGLYAVSGGQLTRIDPMHIRVPDTRIALPALITKPSAVSVPDGHLTFIAYQRDLMTNVPDKASIRVVAQVARVMTFPASGKPTVTPVEGTWAMRAVSVDLSVSPVPDNQEMVMIRPTDPNLSLSSGRYMLTFKNQAYDFAVEGAVTDLAHCLERTETQTGNVFTECREQH